MPADEARDRAHARAHAPALVARVVADAGLRQPADAGDGRKRRHQQHRVVIGTRQRLAAGQRAEHVGRLAVAQRDLAEAQQSQPDLAPRAGGGVPERQEQQEAEDHDDLDRHDRLERVVDLAAKDQRHEREGEQPVRQPAQHAGVDGAGLRQFAQPQREQRRGDAADLVGQQRAEVEDHVDRQPHARPGKRPELAGHDRLAGVERVAAGFDVVDELAQDAQRRDPQQGAAVLRRHGRPQQPFAAADGGARQDQAGPEHRGQRRHPESRRRRQRAQVPPRHAVRPGPRRRLVGRRGRRRDQTRACPSRPTARCSCGRRLDGRHHFLHPAGRRQTTADTRAARGWLR